MLYVNFQLKVYQIMSKAGIRSDEVEFSCEDGKYTAYFKNHNVLISGNSVSSRVQVKYGATLTHTSYATI